jgi:hypothetical protein
MRSGVEDALCRRLMTEHPAVGTMNASLVYPGFPDT